LHRQPGGPSRRDAGAPAAPRGWLSLALHLLCEGAAPLRRRGLQPDRGGQGSPALSVGPPLARGWRAEPGHLATDRPAPHGGQSGGSAGRGRVQDETGGGGLAGAALPAAGRTDAYPEAAAGCRSCCEQCVLSAEYTFGLRHEPTDPAAVRHRPVTSSCTDDTASFYADNTAVGKPVSDAIHRTRRNAREAAAGAGPASPYGARRRRRRDRGPGTDRAHRRARKEEVRYDTEAASGSARCTELIGHSDHSRRRTAVGGGT
jgi:hypothetical protein